jgi:nucleotide-binding universal stress UspA family protein
VLDAADTAIAADVHPDGVTPRVFAEAVTAALTRLGRESGPGVRVRAEVHEGAPADTLIAAAGTASLVVLGSRGRADMTASALGSVANRVAVHSPCPVVVVHAGYAGPASTAPRAGRVVVGVTGTADRAAARWAAEQAARTGASLTLVCAHDSSRARALDAVIPLAREAAEGPDGVDLEIVASTADPAVAVLRAARRADLLVLGCHHRTSHFASRLGSVPTAVWPMARCPVVLVPSSTADAPPDPGEYIDDERRGGPR